MVAAGRLFKLCCRYTLLSAATLSITLGVPGKSEAVNPAALVADINGTATSSLGLTGAVLATLNGTTFFAADDGVHGMELWQSDGTAAGTVMVKDIVPGPASSNPGFFTVANSRLFFSADDGVHGVELWTSDGTDTGTVMVKDLVPGTGSSYPLGRTIVGSDRLFFLKSSANGTELWQTDGSEAGTTLIKEIPRQPFNSFQQTMVNGTLYFVVDDLLYAELWKSDGTDAGTVLVRPLNGPINQLQGCNGLLFYADATEFYTNSPMRLWKSDGSTAGTVIVKALNLVDSPTLACLNDAVYFAASQPADGAELWRSDGTDAGTTQVSDIEPGTTGSSPQLITAANGSIYFTAVTGSYGRELWKSDGTAGGTLLVKDLTPGSSGSTVDRLVTANDKLFLRLQQGSYAELWQSDGTAAGTRYLQNFYQTTQLYAPDNFTTAGTTIFFSAGDQQHGIELWSLQAVDAPISTILSPTTNSVTGGSLTLTGTASADASTSLVRVEVSTDGGTIWNTATGTGSWSYSWTAPGDGVYSIKSRAVDLLGTPQPLPAVVQVTVDTTPPTCAVTFPTPYAAFTVGSSIVVTGTAADAIGLQRVEISLDGGSFWLTANLAGTTWQQTVPIPFQDFLIIVRAIDLAGNQSVSSWIPVTAAPPNSSSSKNGTSFSIRPLFQPSQVLLENITANANDGTICVSDPGMAPPFCGTVYLRFSSDGFTWTQWQAAVTNTPWLMQGNIVCTQFKNRFNTIISTNCLSVQTPSGPVRLDFSAGPSYFLSIATAIGYVANGQTIRLKTSSFTEDLNFNQALSVSLAGGFDDTYQSAGGASILNGGLSVTGNATITVANIQVIGTVTVTDGTVTTDNLSIL